jgi:RNA polymerase sigma factor (sigma-70 family)
MGAKASPDPVSDRDLLASFARERDEAAFATLVRRHGPMVLRACQRMLQNWHDAEDVCQATLLVLASKAGSRGWHASVASWLYQVAYHLSLKAKAAAKRRSLHESRALAQRPSVDPMAEISGRELREVLDHELLRLPEKYRVGLVLCYLEGATCDEAARQLGWPLGTLKSRLDRGRELLRSRLTKRGLTFSPALAAAVLMEDPAQAGVSAALCERMAHGAVLFSKGKATAAGVISAGALGFAESALKSMALHKLKSTAALLVAAGALFGGAGTVAYQVLTAGQPNSDKEQPPKLAAQPVVGLNPDDDKLVRTDRYGDPLPDEALSRLGTLRLRHGAGVSQLGFASDGKSLLSVGRDGVRAWDVGTGMQLRYFPNERASGMGWPSLSTDGKLVSVPAKSGDHIWDVASGRRIGTVGSGETCCPCFSPDGRLLAVRSPDQARSWAFELWDIASGKLLCSGGGDPSCFQYLAFTRDGKCLITAASGMRVPSGPPNAIRFWDTRSGKELREFPFGASQPGIIALSPDGSLLAVICWKDRRCENQIRIWDVDKGTEIRRLVPVAKRAPPQETDCTSAVAFAPDSQTLYTGGIDGSLIAWNPRTGDELRRIGTGLVHPGPLAISPDNKTLAATSGSAIRVIDLQNGEDRFADAGHQFPIESTHIKPNGSAVVTADPYRIKVWNTLNSQELYRIGSDTNTFAAARLINAGRTLLTWEQKSGRSRELRLREVDTGRELGCVTRQQSEEFPEELLAVTPDGNMVALRQRAAVVLVDLKTGAEVRREGNDPWVYGAAFLSDGRTLVAWSRERMVRVWDMDSGHKLRQFPLLHCPDLAIGVTGEWDYCAAVSPDDKLIVYGGKDIVLQELLTGKEVRRIANANVDVLAFSPDGRMLAWTAGNDPRVELMEVCTGQHRHTFGGRPQAERGVTSAPSEDGFSATVSVSIGPKPRIRTLAFSADNRLLVSGNEDGTALVWTLGPDVRNSRAGSASLSEHELDTCWEELADRNAAPAYQALRRLAVGPGQTVPYLAKRLLPVPAMDDARFSRLIADLNNEQFLVRERASQELERLAEAAVTAYQKALQGQPSGELRRRLQELLERELQNQRRLSPDRLRQVRAFEALELIGTREAIQLLEALAHGAPEARLTQESKASLDRLARLSSR